MKRFRAIVPSLLLITVGFFSLGQLVYPSRGASFGAENPGQDRPLATSNEQFEISTSEVKERPIPEQIDLELLIDSMFGDPCVIRTYGCDRRGPPYAEKVRALGLDIYSHSGEAPVVFRIRSYMRKYNYKALNDNEWRYLTESLSDYPADHFGCMEGLSNMPLSPEVSYGVMYFDSCGCAHLLNFQEHPIRLQKSESEKHQELNHFLDRLIELLPWQEQGH